MKTGFVEFFEELARLFPGVAGVALLVFLLIWAVLMFLLPFFVYGAWKRAREISMKMDVLISLQNKNAPVAPTITPPPDS